MVNEEHIEKHDFLARTGLVEQSQRKTFHVIVLTFVTMIAEVVTGYLSGSMALLADGWHMFSHVGALSITWFTYRLARSAKLKASFSFGTGKMLPLGGYTSAILLALVAVFMIYESLERLFQPIAISYREALVVAIIGLFVNLLSAWLLGHSHHDHSHHDHSHHDHSHHDSNLAAAYFHVLADALTSVLAILGLLAAMYFNILWIDALVGVLGALIILKWAYSLIRSTAWELLDGHPDSISVKDIVERLDSVGAHVEDIHFWRIAPQTLAGSIVVKTGQLRGSLFYRKLLAEHYHIEHLVIEEQPFS